MQLHATIEITGPLDTEVELKIDDGDDMIELIVTKNVAEMIDMTLDVSEAKQLRAALSMFIAAAEHNMTNWSDSE